MGIITAAEYARIMQKNSPREALKVRKPIGEGQLRQWKAWLAERQREPGIFIAIRTTTPGNNGVGHWFTKSQAVKKQREAVGLALASVRATLPKFPVKARFIRYGHKGDAHNLPGAMKSVVDEVAKFYGVDDGDARWVFEFDQVVTNQRGCHGVRIELTAINEVTQ
jgi:hypothetical protein